MANRSTHRGLVGPVLVCLGVAGCGDLNQSSRLGDRVELEVFSAAGPTIAPIQPGQADAPSIRGLDRDHWAARSIVQPAGDSASRPNYTSGLEPYFTDSTARQRGLYPTERSAPDTWTHAARLTLTGEGAVAPFWFAFDLVAAPWRMAVNRPWGVVHGPAPAIRVPPAGTTGLDEQP